jgi:hypothetical protein
VATIGPWRRRARPRLTILVASGPFRFVSTLRLARSFAIAVAMIQSLVARYRLPPWFLGCVLVKGTFSIATTQTAPALAGADLPLWLIRLVKAPPRSWLVIAREPPAIVITRIVAIAPIAAAGFVQRFVAPPPRPLRLWARFTITKSLFAASHRTIGFFRIGRPAPLVILSFCRPGDRIEPLTHGHAGSARVVPRSGDRVRTQTSEVPPTARFHSHVQVNLRGRSCSLIQADAVRTRDVEGAHTALRGNVED